MNPLNLNNKVYDFLKYVAQIVLPALGVFVAAVWPVWGWPNTDQIVKTIIAVDALLGALLLISQVQYQKTQPAVPQDPDQPAAGVPPEAPLVDEGH